MKIIKFINISVLFFYKSVDIYLNRWYNLKREKSSDYRTKERRRMNDRTEDIMEKMKKILALLIAATMTVVALTACSGSSTDSDDTESVAVVEKKADKEEKEDKEEKADKEETTEVDGAKESKKVAEEFMAACIAFDLKKMVDYVGEDDSDLPFKDLADAKKTLIDELGEDESMKDFAEEFEGIIDSMFKSMTDAMSYEIEEGKKVVTNNGEKYVYPVTLNLIAEDTDVDTQFEELMEDSMSEEAMQELALELLEEGKITESSSEEEIMKAVFDAILPKMEEAVEKLEWETTSTEGEIVVVEKDGKWVIDVEESTFE